MNRTVEWFLNHDIKPQYLRARLDTFTHIEKRSVLRYHNIRAGIKEAMFIDIQAVWEKLVKPLVLSIDEVAEREGWDKGHEMHSYYNTALRHFTEPPPMPYPITAFGFCEGPTVCLVLCYDENCDAVRHGNRSSPIERMGAYSLGWGETRVLLAMTLVCDDGEVVPIEPEMMPDSETFTDGGNAQFLDALTVVHQACWIMADPDVRAGPQGHRLQPKRQRRTGLVFKRLWLGPTVVRAYRERLAVADAVHKRRHTVRGHFVRRGDLTYWRRAHERGDASLGYVQKDYGVRP